MALKPTKKASTEAKAKKSPAPKKARPAAAKEPAKPAPSAARAAKKAAKEPVARPAAAKKVATRPVPRAASAAPVKAPAAAVSARPQAPAVERPAPAVSFSQSQPASQPSSAPEEAIELPQGYGDERIVLMVRDPWWVFCYWEISRGKIRQGMEQMQQGRFLRGVLRLYDVTGVDFNGSNAHFFKDQDIPFESPNCYLNVWEPNREYLVELGFLDEQGHFLALLRSNVVRTPRAEPSLDWGEDWGIFSPELLQEIYRLSVAGLGSTLGRSSEQLAKMGLTKEGVFPTSPAGGSSPQAPWGRPLPGKEREFFLWCETELILYGGTQPDARLTVAGKEVALRPDGTFSLRFALPDGEQNLEVRATSADRVETRAITPVVRKETR